MAIFLPLAAVGPEIAKSFQVNIFRHRATLFTCSADPAIRNLKGEGLWTEGRARRRELEPERVERAAGTGRDALLRGPAWPAQVVAEWPRLWGLAPRRHAFNGPAWTAAWAASRGPSLDLFSPVVEGPAGIEGILPLVRDPDRVLRFHGRPECDYADLLAAPGNAPAMLERSLRLLLGRRGWRRAELDNVREDGILASALDRLPAGLRRLVSVERQAACPAVSAAVDGPGVFSALAAKDKLRQYHRKLGRLGEVGFRHLASREEALAHLPGFFRQHQERSVLAGRDSQFLDERPRRFYEELVRAMDPATELRFGILTAGDRIAACHFGFEANGRFLFYKPTFDVALWDYSPGQVLLRALFEYAEDRGLGIFDFTIGDEDYKHRFANEVVHTLRITVARSGGSARATGLARAARGRLRELPWLRSLVSSVRARKAPAVRAPGAVLAWRATAVTSEDPAGAARGTSRAERGGLAELAGLSLAHPAAFPAASIPALRLRLKSDELWVARSGGDIVAAAWIGGREEPALWPGAVKYRVISEAWTAEPADLPWWTGELLEAAGANRDEALPLLVLAADGEPLARESARRGWPVAGRLTQVR